MKRFTVGVTTHNEERSISRLLDALASLDPAIVDVILYDDCSTDRTKETVLGHEIAGRNNFLCHFAETNSGTPSVGRTFVGEYAKTEYAILIDGDDQIDRRQLQAFMSRAPSGYDMLLSPYSLRGETVGLSSKTGPIEVDNTTIMRVLSGIGGKVYRSALLREFGADPVRGRSDDVRLNMRILAAGKRKLYQVADTCFYLVEESRKSARVATLNFEEIAARVKRYIALQQIYPIDRRYLGALKRNLRKVIQEDESVKISQKRDLYNQLNSIFEFELKRIIFIGGDLASIGGIPERLRKVQRYSMSRSVEYFLFSTSGAKGIRNAFSADVDEKHMLELMSAWSNSDTVFVTANNLLQKFPNSLKKRINRFPLIYMCSGQMSFIVQDTVALSDLDYVRDFKASRIISFSDADISFQRQLGVVGQEKGFLGVEVRAQNNFDPAVNKYLGYVGRIDFHTKDCGKLIDVARAAKEAGLPPIRVYTTNTDNSPDYCRFMHMAEAEGVLDQFAVVLECSDRDIIYRDISMILLPSKKESFGNVILEAYSYGIPVIGTTYAPGPAELIEHGRTGFLLDDFCGANVVDLVVKTDRRQLREMSAAAFEKHKNYSMDAHFDFLEKVATDVLQEFTGKNTLPVFPELKLARQLGTTKQKPDERKFEEQSLEIELKMLQEENRALRAEMEALRTRATKAVAADGEAPTIEIFSQRQHVAGVKPLSALAAEIRKLESRRAAKMLQRRV